MNDIEVSPLAHYQIIRRNGAVVPFEPNKIAIAMMKAFLAVHGTRATCEPASGELIAAVVAALLRTELLSPMRESRTEAGRKKAVRHVCAARARRRQPNLHSVGPDSWHWKVRDG
jgi:hypothetical protein